MYNKDYGSPYNYNQTTSNHNINNNKSNQKLNHLNSVNRNFLGYSKPIKSELATPLLSNNKNNQSPYSEHDKYTLHNSVLKNRGKEVMGIQPLYQYNDKQEKQKDEVTKRKFDEINESLDIFRTDLVNTMRRINKQQSKLKVDNVLEEMDNFKHTFVDSLVKAERKREEENELALKEMKRLRTEVQRNYDENQNSYKVIRSFQDEIFEFEKEVTNRIHWMEKNQNEQFEKVYALLMNMSLIKKENKEGLNNLVKTDKDELDNDKKLLDKLQSRQNENEAIVEDTLPLSKYRTTNLKDKYVLARLREISKDMFEIKKKIAANSHKEITTKRSLLKSYLNVAYFCSKIYSCSRDSNFKVKFDSLKFFNDFHRSSIVAIEDWIRKACAPAINSIKQTESLNIDMSEMISTNNQDTQDTFIKLKARLEGFIVPLLESIEQVNLDLTTLTWIRINFTTDRVVPFSFYYNFVLSRIRTLNGELVNVEKKHIFIIIAFIVFIYTLIMKVMLSEMKAANSTVRNNFKMIASVYYHSIIKFYYQKMKVTNIVTNYVTTCKHQLQEPITLNIIFNKDSPVYYRKAMKEFYSKQEKLLNDKRADSREIILKLQNEFHNINKDGNNSDIHELSPFLYTEKQLESYFKLAIKNDYDLMKKVNDFTGLFLNKIISFKVPIKI